MVFPEYAARYKKDMASEREALGSVGFVDDADFAVLDSNGNVESYGRSEDFGSAVNVLAERDRNIQNGHLLTADRPDKDEDAEYQGGQSRESQSFLPNGNVVHCIHFHILIIIHEPPIILQILSCCRC